MTLVLERFAYCPWGTYGKVEMPDGQILYTVEQPWNGNKSSTSCIPEGEYKCVPRPYNRGGYDAIHITGVPNRKYILFHIANAPSDVRGCIGVGVDPGLVKGQWAVTSSGKAFTNVLMRHFGGKTFILEIKRSDTLMKGAVL